jgi:hypothetical protein
MRFLLGAENALDIRILLGELDILWLLSRLIQMNRTKCFFHTANNYHQTLYTYVEAGDMVAII